VVDTELEQAVNQAEQNFTQADGPVLDADKPEESDQEKASQPTSECVGETTES
jgi:hypothetical protein